ncbi:MAG: hypothetical protein CVV52_03220 [Spirochaetae bacterium HGW-Spirochaetae-8]|nr:MAG: hypothetical protein CVV52_03220 [Spirochaetae bacterium HGW-Spirochaetae-8]
MHTALSVLIPIICVLIMAATVPALWPSTGTPYTITNFRGETVTIRNHGLYRLDTVSSAAQMQANDLLSLILAAPALIVSHALARKGSLRARLLQSGLLGFVVYTYLTMCVGAAYNPLFLIYTALFGTSLFALILSFQTIDISTLPEAFSDRIPRKTIAAILLAATVFIALAWLGLISSTLRPGSIPPLENTTSLFIQALDLGLIVPTCATTAVLLFKRRAWGYLLAAIGLVKFVTLGLAVTLMVISMHRAGVSTAPMLAIMFPILTALGLIATYLLFINIRTTASLQLQNR